MRAPHPACLLALAVLSAGCIQTRISVELLTQLHDDGSCTRRVSYRLERVDSDQGGARVAIPRDEDPLRQFRIPAQDPWHRRDEAETGLHVVTVEAVLPSPAAVDGDYTRSRSPRAAPSRNAVSAFVDAEHGLYDYREVLQDPASPLAGARLLARLALRADEGFAARFAANAGENTALPPSAEVRRLFRDLFAAPFARDIAALAERPFYGPRERHDLEAIFDRLGARQKELAVRLLAATPGRSQDELEETTDRAIDQMAEPLLAELEAAGLPLLGPEGLDAVRFHATLVMPAPIVRANTCVSGDSAEWDFDENDLFGRGFEMWAVAQAR
ncbi:MAG TPA: hypothetical protein VEQ10_16455 [Vicinamibacteria bacterium]|nr:hypothetical protein [Vicinamibacteria bacterium]